MEPPPLPSIDVLFGRLRRTTNCKRIRPTASKDQQAAALASSTASSSTPILGFFFSSANPQTQAQHHSIEGAAESSPRSNGGGSPLRSSSSSERWETTLSMERLRAALQQDTVNTVAEDAPLRRELWHGVPEQPLLRAEAWRMCLGISPANMSRRMRDALRQLHEYRDYLELYYYEKKQQQQQQQPNGAVTSSSSSSLSLFPAVTAAVPPLDRRTKTERDILNQLAIDLPRHTAALYRHPDLLERLRRLLYVWSLRNPAVGYVQGMDDVVVVLFMAFLDEALAMQAPFAERSAKKKQQQQQQQQQQQVHDSELTIKQWLSLRSELKGVGSPNDAFCRPWTEDLAELTQAVSHLPAAALDIAECDTYNCAGRFLSWGMDRYTFGQPGVLTCVDTIAAGIRRFDKDLFTHLQEVCGVEFRAFAYKYVHLLLVRDLGQWLSMRLFDSLLSAGASGCWEFFSFFCVAWLVSMRQQIIFEVAPEDALTVLQEPGKIGLPAKEGRAALKWIDRLLSQAFLFQLQTKQPPPPPPPQTQSQQQRQGSKSPSPPNVVA